MTKKRRLVAELPEATLDRLTALKAATGADSMKQVVFNAIRVFDYLLQKRREGWTILLVRNGKERELQPFL